MSTTKPSNLQPFKRNNLLPLKNRPRTLLSKKKRPQSVLSPSPSFQSGPASASASASAFLTSNPFSFSQSSQSQSSLSSPPPEPIINDTIMAEKQQHKRTRVKANSSPIWQLGNDMSCLSDVPLFHIPPMTRLVVNMNDNTNRDGNGNRNRNKQGGCINNYNSPNKIATRIVQYIESISGIGNYNSQLVRYILYSEE